MLNKNVVVFTNRGTNRELLKFMDLELNNFESDSETELLNTKTYRENRVYVKNRRNSSTSAKLDLKKFFCFFCR